MLRVEDGRAGHLRDGFGTGRARSNASTVSATVSANCQMRPSTRTFACGPIVPAFVPIICSFSIEKPSPAPKRPAIKCLILKMFIAA